MRTLKSLAGLGLLIAAAVLISGGMHRAAAAQKTEAFTISRAELEQSGATLFNLSLAIGGARVDLLQSDNSDIILKAEITYNDFGPVPKLQTSAAGSLFSATLSSGDESSSTMHQSPSVQTWRVEIGSYSVDTDLMVAGGGVDSKMDFGGMPLRNINLALGGVSANIDFKVPTTRRVESFMVEGGGMNLDINRLGNTDFQSFMLTGGGVLANLDFSGAYISPEHDVKVIGAGSRISLSVPEETGQSLDALSVGGLTIITGDGWKRNINFFFYKNYESSNYETAGATLDMQLISAGSFTTVTRD
jgi:hypothetical protein